MAEDRSKHASDDPAGSDPQPTNAAIPPLLCEACGYALDGLAPTASCSECGRPVADSLPSRREGSRWQQRRSVAAWWGDLLRFALHPNRSFEQIRASGSRGLLFMNLGVVAAAVFVGAIGGAIAERSGMPETAGDAALTLIRSLAFGLGVAALFGILTMVEILGVRFWSRRLVRRIPYESLWSVCSHASFGWLVGGVLIAGLWATAVFWHGPLVALVATPYSSGLALGVPFLAAGFVGMLAFETLVFLGVRKCRYMSPAAIELEQDPAV